MECKFCHGQMEPDSTICPHCGKENAEETAPQTAAPQKNTGALILCIVGLVSLAAALLVVVLFGVNGGWDRLFGSKETTAVTDPSQSIGITEPGKATEPGGTTEPTAYVPGEGVLVRQSYTGEDAAVSAARENVIATMGNRTLKNEEFQTFYWMEFYNFASYNSYYLSYYGLDIAKPLDQQKMMQGDETWQQYFIETALETWRYYETLGIMAEKDGFTMDQEFQKRLADSEDGIRQLAAENGYDDVNLLLREEMGAGASVEGYMEYLATCYLGANYVEWLYEQNTPELAEIEAYYNSHSEQIESTGIDKESGLMSDVRHILIMPEGGVQGSDGYSVYTDDAWAACEKKAQEVLNEWLAGETTEDSFAELTGKYTEDGGYAENGGLYTGIHAQSNYVENFKNWAIDESRKAGDYGLVKTEFGYHIMYMVECDQAWIRYTSETMVAELATELIQEEMDKNTMDVSYENILLGFVDFS